MAVVNITKCYAKPNQATDGQPNSHVELLVSSDMEFTQKCEDGIETVVGSAGYSGAIVAQPSSCTLHLKYIPRYTWLEFGNASKLSLDCADEEPWDNVWFCHPSDINYYYNTKYESEIIFSTSTNQEQIISKYKGEMTPGEI